VNPVPPKVVDLRLPPRLCEGQEGGVGVASFLAGLTSWIRGLVFGLACLHVGGCGRPAVRGAGSPGCLAVAGRSPSYVDFINSIWRVAYLKFGFDHPSAYSAPAGQRGPRPPVNWVGGMCCIMFNQSIFLIVKEREIHL